MKDIDELHAELMALSTMDLVAKMHEVREAKDLLESELKELNHVYDAIRLRAIPQKFEDEGIENLTVAGVGRVSLTGDMYASVRSGMKDQAFQYFRDLGKDSLITETINASTLKATIKSMIQSGEELPEELFSITPFTRASITKR